MGDMMTTTPRQYEPLSVEQLQALHANLNPERVAKRTGGGGRQLSYLEAYDIKATLIRVFGYAGFSADVIDAQIVQIVPGNDKYVTVLAKATVRITIHQTGATYTETAAASQAGSQGIGEVADFALKGLAVDTPIPTPHGWTTMGELQVGDTVFDMDGLPTTVEMKSEVKNLPCYRITFNDGRQIVCDEEHYWFARLNGNRDVRVYQIGDLYETKESGRGVAIPLNGPLHLPDADLPIDPYLLGYWLGDGDTNNGRITVHESDLQPLLTCVEAAGYPSSVRQDRGQVMTVRVGTSDAGSRAGLTAHLREAGILGQKVIPLEYLRGSAAQRLALLQGLMDSDGTVSSGRPVFNSTSRILAEQVAELVHSLGDRPSRSMYNTTGFGKDAVAYSVTWTSTLSPFTLERKRAQVSLRQRTGMNRVRSIEKIDSVPTQCIGVASETKSYLAGEGMVPTHNTAESDALKRAAIYLGTQFGLSLYDDGSTRDVVRRVVSPDQADITRDLVAARQGGTGNAEVDAAANAARQRLQERLKVHKPADVEKAPEPEPAAPEPAQEAQQPAQAPTKPKAAPRARKAPTAREKAARAALAEAEVAVGLATDASER